MYERYYEEFSNEVHKALSCYLYWRMLNQKIAGDEQLLSALNRTPLSWLITRHSLQVTFFIILGRIFDIDDEAFSVDDLLKCCIEEIDTFSLSNLRDRKMNGCNGEEPEWLGGYLAKSHESTEEDFQRLRSEVAKRRKVFEATYKPIRHKLIAHKEKALFDKEDNLWKETNTEEIEEILWFLHDLKETLFGTYADGRRPILEGRKPDLAYYEKDYECLLNSLKKA